jgi:hypothetical protein
MTERWQTGEMPDDVTLPTPEQLALEMAQLAPMDLLLRPESAFHLVGLLQLVLRHPELSDGSSRIARTFIAGVREYFSTCPNVVEVIDRGFDHSQDVPFRR